MRNRLIFAFSSFSPSLVLTCLPFPLTPESFRSSVRKQNVRSARLPPHCHLVDFCTFHSFSLGINFNDSAMNAPFYSG
uniref:Putative secreted peptide n=1 Tax=Anopheles braziliensis TaxID=58242 RepID=A0A2M3ZVJ2_9DIPT